MGTHTVRSHHNDTNSHSNMKFLVTISCLVVACASMPQQLQQPIAIIRQESTLSGPAFSYNFEADNGIAVQATGTPGTAGQSNIQGQYSYTSPEGTPVQILYVCDEQGCRYDSPILPVAPAAPAHVADLLRMAEEQRAAGITFE